MAPAEPRHTMTLHDVLKHPLSVKLAASLSLTTQSSKQLVKKLLVVHLGQFVPTLPAGGFKSLDPQYWQDGNLLQAWCEVLYLCQLVESRLLLDLKLLKKNIGFWTHKMTSSSSRQFMLLGQGPLSFAYDMMGILGFTKGPRKDAVEDIARKVSVLQELEKKLSIALAEVHHATGHLLTASQAVTLHKTGEVGQEQKEESPASIWQALAECLDTLSAAIQPCLHQPASTSKAASPFRAEDGQKEAKVDGDDLEAISQQLEALKSAPNPDYQKVFRAQLQLFSSSVHAAGLSASCRTIDAAMESGAQEAQIHGGFLLSSLPSNLQMPSHLQQHWISYTLLGGASAAVAFWLYRHSPLAGSDDLPRWIKSGWHSTTEAAEARVVQPLMSLRDDFFNTLRSRPGMSSQSVFEQDRASLIKMMRDFEADQPDIKVNASGSGDMHDPTHSNTLDAIEEAAVAEGLKVIRASYEADVKHPITALVRGRLSRSLLIQVAKMKLDLEAAMLQLDQILRANEMSISLIAATPAILISTALVSSLWRVVQPPPPDPKKDALPCRLALLQLIQLLEAKRQGGELQEDDHQADEGVYLAQLNEVYQLAWKVFRMHHFAVLGVRHSEWHSLREDLLQLAKPRVAAGTRLDIMLRMMSTFSILQPA